MSDQKRVSRLSRPRLECLEDRSTPAQFGVPWSDPAHLTLSFVPDGTTALGVPSTLHASLDTQMDHALWQTAILRAFQTWAAVSGVNIGVVADGGQAFNAAGPTQGDSRFGDVRVGAIPMDGALAEASPADPFLSGTLAGDVLFNSQATFTPDLLFGVALHEAGHALGLPPSTNPRSVMFNTFNRNLTLSVSDIAAIRALYGPRAPDANEGAKGNNVLARATRLRYAEADGYAEGELPAVGYGEVTIRADVDIFDLKVPLGYSGPVTFRLQTAGVSLLAPRLKLFGPRGQLLAQAESDSTQGDVLTLTLPQVVSGGRYFIRVDAAPGAAFAIGRYGLAATLDQMVRPTVLPIEEVLRGPYEWLSHEDVGTLFTSPDGLLNDDHGTNETTELATNLKPVPGPVGGSRYVTTGSIATTADADFYRLRAPNGPKGSTFVLTVDVRAATVNGTVPHLELYDDEMTPVPAQVLANGNGRFTIQMTGAAMKSKYFARVAGDAPGNYVLEARFGKASARLQTFSTGSAGGSGELTSTLYVARPQVFGLLLATEGAASATVCVTITDSAGRVVFELSAASGQTVSGTSALLAPGEYQLRATVSGGPLNFRLFGDALNDPIGPQPADTALAPQYTAPEPALMPYLYPEGTQSADPYLWLLWMPI